MSFQFLCTTGLSTFVCDTTSNGQNSFVLIRVRFRPFLSPRLAIPRVRNKAIPFISIKRMSQRIRESVYQCKIFSKRAQTLRTQYSFPPTTDLSGICQVHQTSIANSLITLAISSLGKVALLQTIIHIMYQQYWMLD